MNLLPNFLESPKPPTPAFRVIKLGGSLLESPQSLERFQRWHAKQSTALDLVVVGGGVAVDQLRNWDAKYPLHPESIHFLAIEQMEFNARWLSQLMPDWTLWTVPNHFGSCPSDAIHCVSKVLENAPSSHKWLVNPSPWLENETTLPRDWTVSSDTIAAKLASLLHAHELVLLKSVLPVPNESRQGFSTGPVVDPAFARFSQSIKVLRIVQLTDPAFAELRFGPVTLDDNRS